MIREREPMMAEPKYVPPGGGQALPVVGGDVVTIAVRGADSGGSCTVIEIASPPGGGPPGHRHTLEDETFYVLAGEFEFLLDQETVRASAGAVVFGPRGIPHTFRNVGPSTGRMLRLHPGGIDRFFEELTPLPANLVPAPAALAALAARYGITFEDPAA